MATSGRIEREPGRFFDGGAPGESADPDAPLQILLERHVEDGVESFSLERRVGYDDRRLGRILVPADPGFRTDLASVPWLFTWLVPRSGRHLPAALVHDGLVGGAADDPASYVSVEGHDVARDKADRVFRDAMADTGTALVRRWLIWTAVTVATIFVGSTAWSTWQWWYYRIAVTGTVATVLVLGALSTLDLLGLGWDVPWVGDLRGPAALAGGLAGAVVLPALLGLTWGRFRSAGMIAAVALALLLHVTVALLVLTVLYRLLEAAVQRVPVAVAGATAVVATAAVVGFVMALLAQA